MKFYLVLIIFSLYSGYSFGQTKFLQSLYINTGIGNSMQNGTSIQLGGNITLSRLYNFSFTYYQIGFKDENLTYPTNCGLCLFGPPIHQIDDFEISGSKLFKLSQRFRGGIGIGISYLRYFEPINVTISKGYLINSYKYDEIKNIGYGIKFKGTIEFQALYVLGLGADIFYQYNPYFPYFGVNVKFLLGKLRSQIGSVPSD